MKKLLLSIFILFFVGQNSFAQSSTMSKFKKMIGIKDSVQEKALAHPDSEEMTKSQKAVLYYSQNDIKSALNTIVSIKDDDRTSQDWLLLGNLLQDSEKHSDAIFMYNRAILVDKANYKAYYNIANLYLEDGKFNLAIENYKKATKLNDKFPYAFYNLGCAYVQAGDLKKAKLAFLKAIEIKNTEPDFHYNLALVYKKLGKEKLAKQYLSFYNKLLEDNNG